MGYWQKDRKHGRGTVYYVDGSRLDCYFQDDLAHG